MKKYRTEDLVEIEQILASNVLGKPTSLRFKGNAVRTVGSYKWDFELKVILMFENGDHEDNFYMALQEKTREGAINNIKEFISGLQKSHTIFKSGFVNMKTGKIMEAIDDNN